LAIFSEAKTPLVARERGRRAQKASAGRESDPEILPRFRRMGRAIGRPAGRPYNDLAG